jgi:hypothetical protein
MSQKKGEQRAALKLRELFPPKNFCVSVFLWQAQKNRQRHKILIR